MAPGPLAQHYLNIEHPQPRSSNDTEIYRLWIFKKPYEVPKDELVAHSASTGICIISWVWVIHVGAHLLSIFLRLLKNTHKKTNQKLIKSQPKVVILKPVCGTTKETFENLESFYHLNYKNYEIAYCVGNPNDPVIEVINKLEELNELRSRSGARPKIKTTIFTGTFDHYSDVVNPKVRNMCQAWYDDRFSKEANADFIWISDQRIICQDKDILDNKR